MTSLLGVRVPPPTGAHALVEEVLIHVNAGAKSADASEGRVVLARVGVALELLRCPRAFPPCVVMPTSREQHHQPDFSHPPIFAPAIALAQIPNASPVGTELASGVTPSTPRLLETT